MSGTKAVVTMSPRLHPRPDYGAAVLFRGLIRIVHLPLLYTLLTVVLAPVYASAHAAFSTSPLMSSVTAHFTMRTPWVCLDDTFFMVGLSLSVGIAYVLGNGFYYLLDTRGLLQQYKCPRTPSQAPSAALVRRTLVKEATSHAFTGPLLMVFVVGPGLRAMGSPVSATALPGWRTLWAQFTVQLVVNEMLFYWGHRMLHSKVLYTLVHKQHHSYVGTRSFAGEYAHLFEDILTAYLPFLAGLFLTRAHFHLVFVWFFVRLFLVAEGHSGYCFKGTLMHRIGVSDAIAAAHHDFHHTHPYGGNFGNPLYDWMFGTMDAYVAIGREEGYMGRAAHKAQ